MCGLKYDVNHTKNMDAQLQTFPYISAKGEVMHANSKPFIVKLNAAYTSNLTISSRLRDIFICLYGCSKMFQKFAISTLFKAPKAPNHIPLN